ncbi:MAG: glycoside hydrolase family 37 [Clostridia bacterium]|nr:glycoside hydrolase family 37 [Clostridia bacterium]
MKYDALKQYLLDLSKILWAKPYGDFKYPCIVVTGNNSSYPSQLWDWGNWVNNVALRQIATYQGNQDELLAHEKGSIMNFLNEQKEDGSIEIVIFADKEKNYIKSMPHRNVHKPVLAQHVAFINKYNPDKEWVKEIFPKLKAFNKYYEINAKHESGLFYFFDDFAIGVDNDPATFYRPDNSSASIYLNTLMYMELGSLSHLADFIGNTQDAEYYKTKQKELKDAINELCYDEKDGMYYSCDLNLRPIDTSVKLHSGAPRHYSTLLQRIGCWSSFLPLWAGIATKEQAERIVRENLLDEKAFWAPYGVRTLSKYEKMYRIIGTSNPSSWHGGVWILSNYFVFKGLLRYGYKAEAEEMATKTLDLLAKDFDKNGAFHEYYDPETGEGVFHKGFSSWNLLAFNMLEYFDGKEVIEEFFM